MSSLAYNNNFQLFQNRDHVVMLMEMIHDARIVPLDGRAHISSGILQVLGDPRGRWEGDTLVVETTNFKDKADFFDPTSFTPETDFRESGSHRRVVERFTRMDVDTLLYEYTVDDPTMWQAPWTAQQTLTRNSEPLYEYACHEGNYGMVGILSGARAQEKNAADAVKRGAK